VSTSVVVHPTPAWRDRADFLIAARINQDHPGAQWEWEQLWVRRISPDVFEVCCIPFFVYGVCLGDHISAEIDSKNCYVLGRTVRSSGHVSFRVWLKDDEMKRELPRELEMLGCETERRWETSSLLAVDAATESLARRVADLLHEREEAGLLCYETARLS
jgi:hypothetical protein